MKMFGRFGLTSLAMVVMKAGGRAVAMRERACRAERAESAGGLRGKPMVILWTEREWQRFYSSRLVDTFIIGFGPFMRFDDNKK